MMTWKQGVSVWCAMAAAGAAIAQPANDGCSGAVPISVAVLPYLSPPTDITLAAPLGEFGACEPIGYTVWYKVTATSDHGLFVSTCETFAPGGTAFDTVLQVYSSLDGSCDTLLPVACVDDSCDYRSELTFPTTAGTTYFIQVGQYGSDVPFPGENLLQVYVADPLPPPMNRWVEVGEAGESVVGAQTVEGTGQLGSIQGTLVGADVDLYRIEICDPEAFGATTRGATNFDTQLFLFDAAGLGVTHNDDDPSGVFQSTISGRFVPGAGTYLLAVTGYDRDPVDAFDVALWNNTPFDIERAADGLARLAALHHWSGAALADGGYIIRLSGAAFIGECGDGCPACAADFNQDGGVDGGDVEAFFIAWEAGESCGDVNQDGGVDGGDVEGFFVLWESGGC